MLNSFLIMTAEMLLISKVALNHYVDEHLVITLLQLCSVTVIAVEKRQITFTLNVLFSIRRIETETT